MEIFKDNEIDNKVELEFRMRDFTRYINRKLRAHKFVADWCFTVNSIFEGCLEVTIDYHRRFHSRDMYDVRVNDFDELKTEFDYRFSDHLRELGGIE